MITYTIEHKLRDITVRALLYQDISRVLFYDSSIRNRDFKTILLNTLVRDLSHLRDILLIRQHSLYHRHILPDSPHYPLVRPLDPFDPYHFLHSL